MEMDRTFMVIGSIPHFCFLSSPLQKRIIFNTPMGLFTPTSAKKLLLEVSATRAGGGPPCLQHAGIHYQPAASALTLLLTKYFCFIFFCLCSTSIKGANEKNPVLHSLLRHQHWVLRKQQTLTSCGHTSQGGLPHQ